MDGETALSHSSQACAIFHWQTNVVLEHKFNEWRGHNEQVDDVLVIGIRIG
jgi:hypothetical protein